MPSARPAGLKTDPQAARGLWDRRGLEKPAVHTHCLMPQARGQLQERGGVGTRETLTRVWAMTRGEKWGLSSLQGDSGSKLVPLPLSGKSRGLFLPSWGWRVYENNMGRTVDPKGRESKNRAPGDRGIKQLRRWRALGATSPPPSCLLWPGVLGDSSVAKLLIGVARPGEPKL